MKYLSFYEERGIEIFVAKDQYVWDRAGEKYLDMHTGHGVAFLGHRNRKVVEALKAQLEEVISATPSFKVRAREEAVAALEKVMPKGHSFVTFLNSGSEGVELALKVARRATGRKKLVSFLGSFHGRSMGALSVTGNQSYRRPFEPLVPGVEFLPYNSLESIKAIDQETAGVILEPVQGEGGVVPAKAEFFKAVAERSREVGALLIVDEVQAGFGRTGSIWASQHYGVEPDVLVAGKAIGGGFPVSVVSMREEVGSRLEKGDHGSTYGGNPLACAAVRAAVEVLLEENVAERARYMGAVMREMLSPLGEHRLVREVRGMGLMIGVELRVAPAGVIRCLQSRRVLSLKAGSTTVRFLPPYMITREDAEWGVGALAKCLDEELSSRAPR
ncbi:MAG: aspartate aminotransferase family protein [Acidilobaceae archaeon]|nr:aspartate aminotransferase family protein [Acidilobaceae archaeon]MCX8165938.1 aspartate aminotransferase family protein [Acidilobaceae archaeon]MDW7974581.1 aspartate aminotransferase family protein [Sulfolobales archaeon]